MFIFNGTLDELPVEELERVLAIYNEQDDWAKQKSQPLKTDTEVFDKTGGLFFADNNDKNETEIRPLWTNQQRKLGRLPEV